MKNAVVKRELLCCLYLVWGIPVVLFIAKPSYAPQTWSVWFALFVTILLSIADRQLLVLAIPFVGMIAPLAHSSRFMGLLPSEIFLIYCALFCFLTFAVSKNHRIKLYPCDAYLICLAFLALISYITSFEHVVLLPSFLNLAALIVVFAVTRIALRSTGSVPVYFLSLLLVAGYVSALIVTGFVHGMVLANFMAYSQELFWEKANLQHLFRASYFYTNVLYVLGPAAVVSVVTIVTANRNFHKVISSGVLVAIISSLFLMFAKTALLALVICLPILAVLFLSRMRSARRPRVLHLSLLIVLVIVLLYSSISGIASTSEHYTFRTFSLAERLNVVSASSKILIRHPERLFFGFGPDMLIRLDNEVTDAALFRGSSRQGTIDSAYATFLFEYGLFFLVLFSLFGVHTLLGLFRLMKRNHQSQPVLIGMFVIVVFIYIAAISQRIGTSKVAWVIAQIFALSGICLSRDIEDRRHERLCNA